MRVKSMAVEGYGPFGSFSWNPEALTVLEGASAAALGRALGHLLQAARGWSTLADSLATAQDDLAASPRDEHGEGETRWWICLGAPDDDPTGHDFTAECVIGRYEGGWEVAFERVCRSDDFVEEEIVGRQGMRTTYALPFKLRSMHDRPKREVHTVARDMSVLGAFAPLQRDARVAPFLEALAACGRYVPGAMTRRVDALYGGYHTRLAEDGSNLVNVLAELDVHDLLRPLVGEFLGATVEGYTGHTLGINDAGEATLSVSTAPGEPLAVSALPEAAWRALTSLGLLATPIPPRWLWVEGLGKGVPEALAPRLAALAHGLAGKTQVTLWEPSRAVREHLRGLSEAAGPGERRVVEGSLRPGPDGALVLTADETGG